MFGTRNLFYKANKVNAVQEAESSKHIEFLKRIYQQSKQISQIIAYIWRWADDNGDGNENHLVARELKTYFDKPTSDIAHVGDNLKKLLGANPRDHSIEAKLLRAVFGDAIENENYIFPMFDEFELGKTKYGLGYLFEVNVDAFHGFLNDPDSGDPHLFKFNIPYPPRPFIGDATVNQKDLEDWIENRNPQEYFAENPYIPTTCS